MLVICEECATKYNVNEARIKGERATFSCKKCGHQIVVNKPVKATAPPKDVTQKDQSASVRTETVIISPPTAQEKDASAPAAMEEGGASGTLSAGAVGGKKKKALILSVGVHFLFALVIGFAAITGAIGYLYFFYIPQVLKQDIDIKVLFSTGSIIIIVMIWSLGIMAFFLLARFITRPLQELTAIVHRISLGELDLTIEPKGPREIQELAKACDRMRYSIKEAIKRLKNK